MQRIELKKENHKPQVVMDPEKGYILLDGSLVVPDSVLFFKPIIEWIEEYAASDKKVLNIDFKLWYYNTSASKMILKMFSKLKIASENGLEINVCWYYKKDDDEMLDVAKEIEEISELDFTYKMN